MGLFLKSERAVEVHARCVLASDAGYEGVGGRFAAGTDEAVHELPTYVAVLRFGGEVDGGFERVAVGLALFPRVGVAVTDHFAALFVDEVEAVGGEGRNALGHLGFADGFGLESDGGVKYIFAIDGGNVGRIGGENGTYHS